MPSAVNVARQFLLDALVIVFVTSASAKFVAIPTFRFGLSLLPFMTEPVAAAAAILLPVTELLLAIFLFLNYGWAKSAAIGLLILFSSVAVVAVAMKRQVPCGCFGQLDGQTLSWRTVFRNFILILSVVAVLGLERRTEWSLSVWPVALLFVAALSAVGVYTNHQLILGLRKAKLL
jgi:hypothetical protein